MKSGYTPREAAYQIALNALVAAYNGHGGILANYVSGLQELHDTKKAIAKLHNKLLQDSKLHGLNLYE